MLLANTGYALERGDSRPQANRAGHGSAGEDCGQPHQTVDVNRQFPIWLHPRQSTTDAIFVVRQLQEKYLAANKRLYIAFVDLEKVFDRVPQKVIWWALRKLGVEQWIVRLVQGMCQCMKPCPRW